jgi:hypothetical protein
MDRFNATKLGDPLPILGQAIAEDAETMKQRKKGGKIEWSTDHVYTMALWSGKRDKIPKLIISISLILTFSTAMVKPTLTGVIGKYSIFPAYVLVSVVCLRLANRAWLSLLYNTYFVTNISFDYKYGGCTADKTDPLFATES